MSLPWEADVDVGRQRLRALIELGKPSLSTLVVITSALGYAVAAPAGSWISWRLVATALGAALTAFGACGLNMASEAHLDALMHRTRSRPVPSGRLTRTEAKVWSAGIFGVGYLVLWLGAGVVPAQLALATMIIYAFVYTPAKRWGPFAVAIGAVPGALPVVLGWTAGGGGLASPGAWSLFAVLFAWQFPHFFALAYLHQADYARAGFHFLPRRGARRLILLSTWGLAAASLLPWALGVASYVYGSAALVLGGAAVFATHRVLRTLALSGARRVFLGSLVYLPIVLALLVLDHWRFAS